MAAARKLPVKNYTKYDWFVRNELLYRLEFKINKLQILQKLYQYNCCTFIDAMAECSILTYIHILYAHTSAHHNIFFQPFWFVLDPMLSWWDSAWREMLSWNLRSDQMRLWWQMASMRNKTIGISASTSECYRSILIGVSQLQKTRLL